MANVDTALEFQVRDSYDLNVAKLYQVSIKLDRPIINETREAIILLSGSAVRNITKGGTVYKNEEDIKDACFKQLSHLNNLDDDFKIKKSNLKIKLDKQRSK